MRNKTDKSAYPTQREERTGGYIDWGAMRDVVTVGEHRSWIAYLVPVYCEGCGSTREMKPSDAQRRKTTYCSKCDARLGDAPKRERTLGKIRSRGVVTLPSGAIIHWDRARLKVFKDRKFTVATVTCVCGLERELRIAHSSLDSGSGLCTSCASAYSAYLEHKNASPQRVFDGHYWKVRVARGEFGERMASFRSLSPFALGWVPEHRLVMARKLGRELSSGEHVHHIDGDKENNDPANLLLVDARIHNAITRMEAKYKRRIAELEAGLRSLAPFAPPEALKPLRHLLREGDSR